MIINPVLKSLYTKVYCQSSNADEGILCVGNSEGKIISVDIKKVCPEKQDGSKEQLSNAISMFSAHNDSIYSMTSTGTFLVTGATGMISGWKWKNIQGKPTNASWSIHLECDQSNFGTPEVNSLAYEPERNWVYAACGDWRTRGYDLETGQDTLVLSGHEDYVHDVVISGNQVISAGEDGLVLLWDSRAGREPKVKLKPSSLNDLQRPSCGSFISSVDVENDWLICGGGPRAGVFHLRSLALTSALEPKESPVNVTKFVRHECERGNIVVAGSESYVHVCNISGELTAEIPTSCTCVYSIHVVDKPYSVAFIGGTGPKLDICLNFNYRDHSIWLTE